MLRLRGNSPATVDEKGRIKIPSGFKSALDSISHAADHECLRFYLTSLDGQCALLFPLPIWEKIEDKLDKLPSTLGARNSYLNSSSYYGSEVEPDAQGRFVIQPILRSKANLVGEVVILGKMNHLAIWNRSAFEARINAEPLTPGHLDQLADLGV